jgi:hypothetical protein
VLHTPVCRIPLEFPLVAVPLQKKTAIFALCGTDTVGRNSDWSQVDLALDQGSRPSGGDRSWA